MDICILEIELMMRVLTSIGYIYSPNELYVTSFADKRFTSPEKHIENIIAAPVFQ